MAKIYSKKNAITKEAKPNSEVISFLLNYSKALTVVKTAHIKFEIIKN